jgi:hypothetical protein
MARSSEGTDWCAQEVIHTVEVRNAVDAKCWRLQALLSKIWECLKSKIHRLVRGPKPSLVV